MPTISGQPAATGQQVMARKYVTEGPRGLPVGDLVGTVTALHGPVIEVAWPGLPIRLGMRSSHLMLAANAAHRPATR